jgi:hypothetical protein
MEQKHGAEAWSRGMEQRHGAEIGMEPNPVAESWSKREHGAESWNRGMEEQAA